MLALASCHGSDTSVSSQDAAVCDSAQAYYGYLIRGQYDLYVRRLHGYDNMCTNQRTQMVELMRSYMQKEQKRHGGISTAVALRDTVVDDRAQVLLQLTYGNGEHEQVAMPLIRVQDGSWVMQ